MSFKSAQQVKSHFTDQLTDMLNRIKVTPWSCNSCSLKNVQDLVIWRHFIYQSMTRKPIYCSRKRTSTTVTIMRLNNSKHIHETIGFDPKWNLLNKNTRQRPVNKALLVIFVCSWQHSLHSEPPAVTECPPFTHKQLFVILLEVIGKFLHIFPHKYTARL